MTAIAVTVPDIGDFKEVEIIELLVKPGDTIALDQSLITVESDKASMEIPSSAAGRVLAMQVKVGDKVSQGSVLLTVEPVSAAPDAAASTSAAAPIAVPPAATAAKVAATAVKPAVAVQLPLPETAPSRPLPSAPVKIATALDAQDKPHASPSVRRFARELGVDLAQVVGTGPKQRISQDDVQAHVKAVMSGAAQAVHSAALAGASNAAAGSSASGGLAVAAWPKVDFAKYGAVQSQPLSRIKKLSGANLHRNWVMIPHVTNHDDADITDLEALRVQLNDENAKTGVKLTMLAFLIKACVAALKRFPEFNSSLDGENLVLKQYYHIGFAADTPNGLVVPVIKNADQKGLLELARETSELAAKARDGKIMLADMQGGTFSISSLGGIGGTYFTPIINAPEVAILGVCRASKRPVWSESAKSFEPRLILPLSLSWDHRVVDGAAAARFCAYLSQLLADFRRISL